MQIPDLKITRRRLAFLGIFILVSLALYQIKFSDILGVQSQNFTLFQLVGPISAGILGPVLGIVSVLAVEGLNFLIGKGTLDLITIARLFPMAFAALYFGSKNKLTAIPALVCMVLFWLSPVGMQVWYYPLYWLIPIAASFYKDNLLARSLGATFTAHAIGSVAFLYAYNIPASVWAMLIPVVAVERLTFAAGIVVSYYAANTLLGLASSKIKIDVSKFANEEKKYALVRAEDDG